MKVAVFGLGNVGLVAALCLLHEGHEVTGVEVSPWKIDSLQKGEVYLHEKGLKELLIQHKERFKLTSNANEACDADCFIICVGTPSLIDGEVHLEQVKSTFLALSEIMKEDKESVIILRSTVPPGTVRSLVLPILQSSRKSFQLIYHPEFLREGSAVNDYLQPNLHVIGLENPGSQIPCAKIFNKAANIRLVSFETAEMLKYMNNSFHALKVAFVNEISSLANSFSVDVNALVDSFLTDDKLNISREYFKPGYAFGGPCLTKELKAINYLSKSKKIEVPLISSILPSNEEHIFRTLQNIKKINPSKILFFGVSFKEGTDDLRSSPILDLINHLHGGPTYLRKKEIFIRDNEIVLTMKPELSRHHLMKSCENLPQDIGLVVLGSFRPDENDGKWLCSYNGPVIDLSFYGDELKLKNKTIKGYEVT